jgi:hypothetical protein
VSTPGQLPVSATAARGCARNVPSGSASRYWAHGRSLWHHERTVSLLRIASLRRGRLPVVVALFRSAQALRTENLFLRRQLALYIERGIPPRRLDAATRVSLALLARLFDWRGALVVVQPATMIRWHRAGWRLLWRMKSRAGRPPIPMELRELIRNRSPRSSL